jgi:hypothetical protein
MSSSGIALALNGSTNRLALGVAYAQMSRGDIVTRSELRSYVMPTQSMRRERGPTPLLRTQPQPAPRAASAPRYGVVVKEVRGPDGPTYQATAYLAESGGRREPIVNRNGRPLVAVAATPMKAASYLLAALRRRTS